MYIKILQAHAVKTGGQIKTRTPLRIRVYEKAY